MSIAAESQNTAVIQLGYRNEKDVTKITFDITEWVTQYPGIICQLTVTDKENKCFVPSGQTQNGNTLEWSLRRDVTGTEGDKEIVLRGVTDTVEKRSAIFRGYVKKSHAEPGTPPEEIQGWISDLMLKEGERRAAEASRAEAETARDNAEKARNESETGRGTAETVRGQDESARGQNEQTRNFNEGQRVQRDLERSSAEEIRKSAEQGRAQAELDRAAFYAGFNAALNGKAAQGQVMRKLISRTIAPGENVAAITWTQDDAGQALALVEAEIRLFVPSNTLAAGYTAYVLYRINDVASGYYTNEGESSGAIYGPAVWSVYGEGVTTIKYIAGVLSSRTDSHYSSGTARAYNGGRWGIRTQMPSQTMNSIYAYISGLSFFPAGTVIEIWGRTA